MRRPEGPSFKYWFHIYVPLSNRPVDPKVGGPSKGSALFPDSRLVVDGVVAECIEKGRECDVHFEAGEGCPKAMMDAAAEGNRSWVGSVYPKFVGVGPASKVSVCGSEHKPNICARRDRGGTSSYRASGGSNGDLCRCVVTE
jgi:hypothetical protein